MSATVLLTAAVALIVALMVNLHAMRIGHALGLLDWPDPRGGRKLHARVTPLVGGTAIMLPALAAIAMIVVTGDAPLLEYSLGWIALTSGSLYLVGLVDDRFDLGARMRLLFATLLFLAMCVHAPDLRVAFLRFQLFDALVVLGPMATGFTMLCLVGLLNAVNMADGKNGIVLSLSLMWSLILVVSSPPELVPLFAALIVAIGVTLFFNMRGLLFLGDGGSYGLSALTGVLAIYVYNHDFENLTAGRLALLFCIPVFDTMRLITTRAARGRSPFAADRDHLHHHLHFKFGWPVGLRIYMALVVPPNVIAALYPMAALPLLFASLLAYSVLLLATSRRSGFSADLGSAASQALREGGGQATSR